MKSDKHVMLVFLDGVGVGSKNPKINPCFNANLSNLKKYFDGNIPSKKSNHFRNKECSYTSINATLGVSGLPQSGTGQSALLTGVNTAKVIGKHFGPYLYSSLKSIVEERNIFKQLQNAGYQSCYANAFPKQYFDYIATHNRDAAISYAWRSTGAALNDADTLRNHHGLSADITNDRWDSLGYSDITPITVEQAAKRFIKIAERCNFVLFEFFYTDHAGHSQSMHQAVSVLEKIDSFIGNIVEKMDRNKMMLVITSDHGNIEDLSTKSHTRNPVPFFAIGKNHHLFTKKVKKITDVTPAILEFIKS